jgi:hypothetical protein
MAHQVDLVLTEALTQVVGHLQRIGDALICCDGLQWDVRGEEGALDQLTHIPMLGG